MSGAVEEFTKFYREQKQELTKLWNNKGKLTYQVLNLAMIVFSALMMWKSLIVLSNSEAPVVVVLSGSMEPAFQRGDILFLNNNDASPPIIPTWPMDFGLGPIRTGEIVVFKIKGRDIPIVHRVLKVHEQILDDGTPEIYMLTKGDNNQVDDRGLYSPGQMWLKREDIHGRARAAVPYLGMVTIILNDYPMLKYVMLGTMGLFVLTSKEQA